MKTISLLATLSLLVTTGCQVSRSIVKPSLVTSPALQQVKPQDVAVLPIEDATPGRSLGRHGGHLREELSRMLVRRKYSPLAPRAVDAACAGKLPDDGAPGKASIVSAAVLKDLAGSCEEDALLAVQVGRWDESSLLSRGVVRFSARVNMFGSKSKRTLWSGTMQGTVKAGGLNPAPLDPTERARSAVRQFAYELMTRLPSRML